MKTHFAAIALAASLALAPAQAAEKKSATSNAPAKAKASAEKKASDPYRITIKTLPGNWAKRLAAEKKADRERIAELIELVTENKDEGPGSLDINFLRRHRDTVVPTLQKAIATDWHAGTALQTLMEIGAPGARDRWFAEFAGGDAKARLDLLQVKASDETGHDLTEPRNKEELALYLDALKKGPGFTPEAAFALPDLTSVASALIDQFPDMTMAQRWAIAGALADNSRSAGHPLPAAEVRRLLAWVREHPRTEEDELHRSLELTAGILKLGGETAAEAEKLFLELAANSSSELIQPRSEHVAYRICQIGGPAFRPIFERIRTNSRDRPLAAAGFAALARLRGAEPFPDLEPIIGTGESEDNKVWRTLCGLARGGAREAADAWFLKKITELEYDATYYAAHYGGPEVLKRALQSGDEITPLQRFELRWRLDGTTLASFFGRLQELGLTSRMPTAAELAAAGKYRDTEDLETRDALSMLEDVGCMLSILGRAEDQPLSYSDLLHTFSAFTRGAFVPSGVKQESFDPDGEGLGNNVSFAASGQLITFRAGPYGHRFDMGAAHAAVNRALELAGKKERLMVIESDDSIKTYVFGLPGPWKQFATEFSLPLSEAPLPMDED